MHKIFRNKLYSCTVPVLLFEYKNQFVEKLSSAERIAVGAKVYLFSRKLFTLNWYATNTALFKFNIKFGMHYDVSCSFVQIIVHYNFFLYVLHLLHHSFKVNYSYHNYFYSILLIHLASDVNYGF